MGVRTSKTLCKSRAFGADKLTQPLHCVNRALVESQMLCAYQHIQLYVCFLAGMFKCLASTKCRTDSQISKEMQT